MINGIQKTQREWRNRQTRELSPYRLPQIDSGNGSKGNRKEENGNPAAMAAKTNACIRGTRVTKRKINAKNDAGVEDEIVEYLATIRTGWHTLPLLLINPALRHRPREFMRVTPRR